jgi:hypothetical protein
MKISNFDEFLRSYSTMEETCQCSLLWWVPTHQCRLYRHVWTHWCRLHRWVQTHWCSLNRVVCKNFVPTKTHLYRPYRQVTARLTGVCYTSEFRFLGAAYTSESKVQVSRLANAVKRIIPQKQTVGAKYWLIGRISCFKNFPILTHSDWFPGVSYTGEST